MSKKNETKVLCPECGAELAIADKTITTVATVIGKDAGIGVVYAEVVGKEVKPAKKTAQDRQGAYRGAARCRRRCEPPLCYAGCQWW